MAGRLETFIARACPGAPEQGGQTRTSPGMAAGVSEESRSSGKSVAMRQVQGQATKSIHRSGSGPVKVTSTRQHHTFICIYKFPSARYFPY